MSRWIYNLLYKMRKRRFCKLNGWFCPDCIYHDFTFEGSIFRGNRCRYPTADGKRGRVMIKEVEEMLKEKMSLEREYLELVYIADEMSLPAELNKKMMIANIAHSLSVIADTLADRKEQA